VLDLLVTASTTVSQLEDLNDALLEHFVSGCRREGKSWSEISAALGVSKQAVHKRFSGPIADRIISSTSAPTFERFTDRARTALKEATQAARARGGTEVDAGDLLAGLLAVPEGLAAKVLVAMGVTADAVRAARPAAATPPAAPPAPQAPPSAPATPPAEAATAGPDSAAGARRPPFAPDAATALRNALAEALELGHNYIGTEHILLGVMRDPDAPAAGLLSRLGASPAEARVRIAELLRGFTAGPVAPQ
jgi:ATP-dependent Clp protease ATP-binding subunit ClpA